MDKPIRGSFPGGPTRRDPDEPAPPTPHLPRMADVEERTSRRALGATRRRRRLRTRLGFVLVLASGFAVGAALGYAGRTTPEELTAAREEARQRDLSVSSEVNRVLLELWKMEDVEAVRNMGRTR